MILVHHFSAISKSAWSYCKVHLTHNAMSNAAYDICGVIYQHPHCNQDLIAHLLNMDKSSVAKILSKCETDGIRGSNHQSVWKEDLSMNGYTDPLHDGSMHFPMLNQTHCVF